jgi:hypothetical protein
MSGIIHLMQHIFVMKTLLPLILFTLIACNEATREKETEKNDSAGVETPVKPPAKEDSVKVVKDSSTIKPSRTYSNERFREVIVTKTGAARYNIRGEAQIFEANFGWVVEDGHNELKKGNEMTDAGAPAWGNFNFSFSVKKDRPNSTLTLILFESSPKDGSRQYELPIALE